MAGEVAGLAGVFARSVGGRAMGDQGGWEMADEVGDGR